jgi:steroid delta-isomerase-like uncharacterized protein
MRRFSTPLSVVAVVLLSLTTIGGLHTSAQEATPGASPVAVPEFLQRLIDGVNTGDGAAIAALYTEDGIYEDIQSGAVAHGREEIAAFIEQSDAIFTDVEIRPITVHAGNGWAAYEYVYTATEAKSGARLDIRGATFYVLEDGLIRHSTDYYALPTAKQQG